MSAGRYLAQLLEDFVVPDGLAGHGWFHRRGPARLPAARSVALAELVGLDQSLALLNDNPLVDLDGFERIFGLG